MRRLLENGANSSFVERRRRSDVPIDALLAPPGRYRRQPDARRAIRSIAAAARPLSRERHESRGVEFGDRAALEALWPSRARREPPGPRRAADRRHAVDGRRAPSCRPIDGRTWSARRRGRRRHGRPRDGGARRPASPPGATRRPTARAAALERAADLIEARRDRFIALLRTKAARRSTTASPRSARRPTSAATTPPRRRRLFGAASSCPARPAREPLRLRGRGVFVCISPWNFPLAIFLGQVAAALAAGNAVVAKPAEQTPLIAFEAVRLLHEAGVPAGALHCVPGDGSDRRGAGRAIRASPASPSPARPRWRSSINRALAAKDGPIVPLIAETGGINAMIVDATALPEQVADDVVTSAFRSAGQRCSASRLLFVQEDVADDMLTNDRRRARGAARSATRRSGDGYRPGHRSPRRRQRSTSTSPR